MPYRGPEGFSWQGADVSTRRRALAALVLLGAGWAIGFFAGRMSAWLFPVAETNIAAVATAPPAALQPPPPSPQRDATQATVVPPPSPAGNTTAAQNSSDEKLASPSPSPATAPASAPPSHAASVSTAQTSPPPDKVEPAPAQGAAKADTQEPDASRGVVLVNPEWKQQPSKVDREPEPERSAYGPEPGTERGRLGDEAALAKCESRYSSFRRSDGTYQPFGRSSRELCPFLTDMPRRSRY